MTLRPPFVQDNILRHYPDCVCTSDTLVVIKLKQYIYNCQFNFELKVYFQLL